nr:hypothetical protein [Cytobacillus firmus]
MIKKISKNKEFFYGIRDLMNTHPIEVDEELPIIQLDFDSYVSYSIINESFTVLDDYEIFEGKSFGIFKKSRYLDFINKGTIANDVFPEEQLRDSLFRPYH